MEPCARALGLALALALLEPRVSGGESVVVQAASNRTSAAAVVALQPPPMPAPKKLALQEHWSPSQPDYWPGLPPRAPDPPTAYNYLQPAPPADELPIGAGNYPPMAVIATNELRGEQHLYPYALQEAYPLQYPRPPGGVDPALAPTAKHFVVVSFIGLLLLFAIIQNSIAAAKRKDALVEVLANRRERALALVADEPTERPPPPQLQFENVAFERVRCVQRTVCLDNRELRRRLGLLGTLLARLLARSVQGSLKETSPGWELVVGEAAECGLRGEDCERLYGDCSSNHDRAQPEPDPAQPDDA